VRHAGLVLAELDALDAEELPRRPAHPLLGRASLHAATIAGGTGLSTYPDRCAFTVERRMLPGESARAVVEEIEGACARVRARRAAFDASVSLAFAQPPSDVARDAPIVRALADALAAAGAPAPIAGMSAWTDAALLNDAGIPAICFGPGDIALAHSAEEWVPVDELHRATDVLARLVAAWCA
jgi:acetylornithine deacetylase